MNPTRIGNRQLSTRRQILFLSLLVLALVSISLISHRNSYRGLFISSEQYRTTQGQITQSFLVFTRGRAPSCQYRISYRFRVGTIFYSSNQINFGKLGDSDFEFANSYVKRYPVGRTIQVFYKADEPNFSVLEPQVFNQTRTIFAGLIFFLVASLSGIIWSIRKFKFQPRTKNPASKI